MFAAEVPIFLLKSQFLFIWLDGISGKKLDNLWKLVECTFPVGLGESFLIEQARWLKRLHLAGNNNALQLYILAISCHLFMQTSFSKGKLKSIKMYLC